jgi:hypothetical protein
MSDPVVRDLVRNAFAAGLRGEELPVRPAATIASAVRMRVGELLVETLLPDLEEVVQAALDLAVERSQADG